MEGSPTTARVPEARRSPDARLTAVGELDASGFEGALD
jgi:hypothetical protein